MDKNFFATRTHWPQASNALNKALEALQAQNISYIDLTASNPTVCGFSYPSEILSGLTATDNLVYSPDSRGLLHARQEVSGLYAKTGIHISAQDIFLTASTSEAYSFLLRLLVNPGERVLIPKPSYPLFQFLLEINDVAFDYYPLVYQGQWRIDQEALKRLIDSKTRAIVLVNPNNPTGSYINREELDFLNQLCAQHKMSIISDEVFFDYAWGRNDGVSCVGNLEVLTFVLSGLSKTLCLPQMKCAWVLPSGPKSLLQEALNRLEIIADTYLSVNTPVQNALEGWVNCIPVVQKQIKDRVAQNQKYLLEQVDRHAQVLETQGGWYAILRIPAIKSEEEWILEFLREDQVLVHPGYFFDFEQEAYIIISLLPSPEIFQEGVRRLMRRLSKI